MELDNIYKPFLDFMKEHQFSTFLLQGPIDEESNEVVFYFPDNVRGDKENHKLYVEFTIPNTVIDTVIESQKQLQKICAAFD